jgi:transcriptional regulator with XRE-family HTH domain
MEMIVVPTAEHEPRTIKERLEPFKEINEKKVPWDERIQLIKRQFPSVAALDWHKVFGEDPALMGRIINDIIKVDAAQPGKPGKRPAVDPETAQQRLRQMCGDDYTALPFKDAFKALTHDRSIRGIANKTHLDRNYVHRLLNGTATPTAEVMEQVAVAFNKDPSYFSEYRVAYLFAVLFYKLEQTPEASVAFYRKVRGNI